MLAGARTFELLPSIGRSRNGLVVQVRHFSQDQLLSPIAAVSGTSVAFASRAANTVGSVPIILVALPIYDNENPRGLRFAGVAQGAFDWDARSYVYKGLMLTAGFVNLPLTPGCAPYPRPEQERGTAVITVSLTRVR